MRVFVDTNVLFDFFAQREPFVASARKLFVMQAFGDIELWTAPQSYLSIFFVLNKTQPAALLQHAFAASLAKINICTTGHKDVLEAIDADWNDLEDALIAQSCKKVAADYLLTRDEKQAGFKDLGIPALSPEAFFEQVKQERGIIYDEIEL